MSIQQPYFPNKINQTFIQSSTLVGCFSCLRVYPSSLLNENNENNENNKTSLCFYCKCDCLLPNSIIKDVNMRFLREMRVRWLANIIEKEQKLYFTNIEVKRCEDDIKRMKELEGKTVNRQTRYPKSKYDVWANIDGNESETKDCVVNRVTIQQAKEIVSILESAQDKNILDLLSTYYLLEIN